MSERWKITEHARGRMEEMALTRREVLEPLIDPVLDYPGSARYQEGRRVAVQGRLAVVYEPETRTIVTVLWNAEVARHPELVGAS